MPKLRIKADGRIHVDVDEAAQQIILMAITHEYIHRLHGKYKGKGLLKALLAEKQREREQ